MMRWRRLVYNEHAVMDPAPRNILVEDLVATLRRGQAAIVVLEPGDMTRYVLTICPYQGGYHIVRFTGNETRAAWLHEHDWVEKVCGSNEWSRILIPWWIDGLMNYL